MIGKCPNCEISLKDGPFNDRDVNEVMITLKYRDFVENNTKLESIESAGYCVVCNAKLDDLKTQKVIQERKVIPA